MRIWRSWWIIVCLVAGIVCYYLPWFTHSSAGFTMNAFDLAEWSSLHPAVRSSSPPMLTSFLLRLPHLTLAVGLALAANLLIDPRARWLVRLGAALLVLRLLPPAEFLTSARDDPNYRQMALLTVLGAALLTLAIPFFRLGPRWQLVTLVGLVFVGTLAGWVGLSRAAVLLDNFEIDVKTGPGVIGLSLFVILAAIGAVWPHHPKENGRLTTVNRRHRVDLKTP